MPQPSLQDLAAQFVAEVIAELPLKVKTSLARMHKHKIEEFEQVLEFFVRARLGAAFGDQDCSFILNLFALRLRQAYGLRVVP